MRKRLTRLSIVLWGFTLWALFPVTPRSWSMAALHRYLRAAYAWRRRWVPARARLVTRWETERTTNHR